jgi:hypothetical protein
MALGLGNNLIRNGGSAITREPTVLILSIAGVVTILTLNIGSIETALTINL